MAAVLQHLYAVRADDGSEEWATTIGSKPTGDPVVAGDTGLVGFNPDGRVPAVSRDDGDVQWSFQTGGSVKAPVSLVENAALVPSPDEHLYGIYG